ncbi:MAG: hypothetical protein EZS28_029744 [Streblomastix strix]|uniref:Uncharacterized protein n=1 Tax=Streblomastix strix TaxID=222440 RepID=A0A5J4UW78_9EUKA|nr:MAG: hypothetical protein EZS28_029744 [Streblomastix strix]
MNKGISIAVDISLTNVQLLDQHENIPPYRISKLCMNRINISVITINNAANTGPTPISTLIQVDDQHLNASLPNRQVKGPKNIFRNGIKYAVEVFCSIMKKNFIMECGNYFPDSVQYPIINYPKNTKYIRDDKKDVITTMQQSVFHATEKSKYQKMFRTVCPKFPYKGIFVLRSTHPIHCNAIKNRTKILNISHY